MLGDPVLPYSGFLWILRIALIVAVVSHVWAAARLWRRANHARSTPYTTFRPVQATWSSRTMRWGGLTILLFVIFHLLQFTTVTIEVGGSFGDGSERFAFGSGFRLEVESGRKGEVLECHGVVVPPCCWMIAIRRSCCHCPYFMDSTG